MKYESAASSVVQVSDDSVQVASRRRPGSSTLRQVENLVVP